MINQFSRSPKLQSVLSIIEAEPFKYSDKEIVQCVDEFLPSQNCGGAAVGYFSIISHVLYYRSDLEIPLMKIALKPLYYLGIEDSRIAVKWIQEYVREINKQDYYTSKQGRLWIEGDLKNKSEIIANIFEEIEAEDNAEWRS